MRKTYIIGLILVLILVASCTRTGLQTTDELKKFESRQEIIDFLEANQAYNYGSNSYAFGRDLAALGAAESDGAVKTAAPSSGQAASDYSTTNIQVEGVDEADFIKNDGKYIYIVSGTNLIIVDAYPAENAEIISKTDIEGYPTELFLNDDKLVVFTQVDSETYIFPEYDILPMPSYKQNTKAIVYDISDRENPEIEKEYELEGYYVNSRMIGDNVYLIVQENVYYYDGFVDLPVVKESSRIIAEPDIYYFDNPEDNYNFNTIMSFNLKSGETDAETFMMGYANTIYVSKDNIYVTYQKNLPFRYYEESNRDRFYNVVVPLLPVSARTEINTIRNMDISDTEKWSRISNVLEEMYSDMDEDDKQELVEEIEEAVNEYEIKQQEERQKTVIHKIGIDNGDITYESRGEVKGYLLDQFSMDEHEGNLRVATTFSTWLRDGSVTYNNVYVLDEDLEIIGSEEEIAPDESIYSTRFMGDRLYMVTFRQIDPFFVIDLSDAADPEVLGYLKIPGFSDYLHPYDENHIIGVGKETGENEYGQTTVKGVKIALFDVSDVSSPELVDMYEIGEQGTDSEALYDHRAFLFDKEKGLLVLPIMEMKGKQEYDPRMGYYRQDTWQGAYVFDIDENGFELRGKVSHDEALDYYYDYQNTVRRSLFMDDVLYTVSMKAIKMSDLESLELLNEVELPYTKYDYGRPMPLVVAE
ncbi:TPA: copper amine oxidase [Candidatus Woesearchaeota archaeon]|nr:hypothetical protein QT06_C0001G1280 [archaeon GW2011_AR15]MBS3104261.1 beta-propeller domain-containing protein [Candidatus Woesearchaeota archaeon]HIH41826.1 copper amine oxidase [Candidatus Woesearchaeota archaeon]